MSNRPNWYISHGNYIVCNRNMVKKVGPSSAILLGELISWESRLIENGKISEYSSFYMRQDLIKDRIGFSQEKQYSCIKKLQELGIIKFERRGIPYRNHYIIDRNKIEEILEEVDQKNSMEAIDRDQRSVMAAVSGQYISNNISSDKGSQIEKELRSFSLSNPTGINQTPVDSGTLVVSPLKRRTVKTPIEFEKVPRQRYNGVALDIINYWNSSPGLAHHRTPKTINNQLTSPTKVFLNAVSTIEKVTRGNYFNSVGLSKHERIYTKDELITSIDRFKLMATSPSYLPVSKEYIRRIGLNEFFYNPFANGVPSYFIKCLEEEPKLVTSNVKREEEKNPQLTIWLREVYIEKVLMGTPQKFNRLDENKFIKGANILHHTMRHLQRRLNMTTRPQEWCNIVVDCLVDKWGRDKVYIGHLASDYTYNDTLVRYLKNRGRLD